MKNPVLHIQAQAKEKPMKNKKRIQRQALKLIKKLLTMTQELMEKQYNSQLKFLSTIKYNFNKRIS